MTDDELQQRLRRLAARPQADWDAMAQAVRDGYGRELRNRNSVIRRRRWLVSAGGALAVAATVLFWVHGHPRPHRATSEPVETFHVFEDLEPGEMIEELSPEQVERVAKAFNKGA